MKDTIKITVSKKVGDVLEKHLEEKRIRNEETREKFRKGEIKIK